MPPKPGVMPRLTSGWPKRAPVGREADVAGQRELAAAAEGEAVDGGDPGLRRPFDRRDDPAPQQRRPTGVLGGHVAKLGDVGAGHEGLVAGPGQHDRAHPGVVRDLAGDGEQLLVGRRVQGVQHLGTGDRDDGDGAVALDLDCHARTLLARRWAAIGPGQLYPTAATDSEGSAAHCVRGGDGETRGWAAGAPASRPARRRRGGDGGGGPGLTAAGRACRGRAGGRACRRPQPSRHPRPEGGSARPGGGRVLPRTPLSARRSPDRSRATFAVGGRVCFPLAHACELPHRTSTSHSRPLSARFDRPDADATDATTKRARTRPIVVLRESVVNRAFLFVSSRLTHASRLNRFQPDPYRIAQRRPRSWPNSRPPAPRPSRRPPGRDIVILYRTGRVWWASLRSRRGRRNPCARCRPRAPARRRARRPAAAQRRCSPERRRALLAGGCAASPATTPTAAPSATGARQPGGLLVAGRHGHAVARRHHHGRPGAAGRGRDGRALLAAGRRPSLPRPSHGRHARLARRRRGEGGQRRRVLGHRARPRRVGRPRPSGRCRRTAPRSSSP